VTDEGVSQPPRRAVPPAVVAPSNRVNVALPFSRIHVEEPTKELGELAAIVAELVSIVEGLTSDTRIAALRARVDTLSSRFR
jgi:hypothetical protein